MADQLTPSTATLAIHGDDNLDYALLTDVSPPIHTSTIFHFPRDPANLVTADEHFSALSNDPHYKMPNLYARYQGPTSTRLERILSTLLDGHAVTYSSGLAGFHALLVRVNPKRLAIGNSYHGCHAIADIFTRLTGLEKIPLDTPAEELRPGDLVHLETPLNPFGTATSIAIYAERAHSRGAVLSVDATFAPPPLQNPFAQGADYVMHSATKYIGGHSDLLGGVIVTKKLEEALKFIEERSRLGSIMGNLESWLGLRSIRTFDLRIRRQSASATSLARWLHSLSQTDATIGSVVKRVTHASLQPAEPWLQEQMPNGFGAVFALYTHTKAQAKTLPSKLQYFQHATSLGGVESLIEWRSMSDGHIEPTVVRVSVGLEGWEDLRDDLEKGLREIAALKLE